MTEALGPLNMHGHANTREEELLEVARERDELRAANEELKRVLALVSKAGRADNDDNEKLRAEVERLRALCKEALEHVEWYFDGGPLGEGWQSDELKALIQRLEAA